MKETICLIVCIFIVLQSFKPGKDIMDIPEGQAVAKMFGVAKHDVQRIKNKVGRK